jgi:dihydroorotate dehydrogenase electron transfer subunit
VQQYGDPPRHVEPLKRITLCYGAQKASRLAGVEDFRSHGIEVLVATDNGSIGHHGFVTAVLEDVLQASGGGEGTSVVCCGPESMMAAASDVCRQHNVGCLVSLETPMACGLGICFSCVARVRVSADAWDYKRTCVDGPIFDAQRIVW